MVEDNILIEFIAGRKAVKISSQEEYEKLLRLLLKYDLFSMYEWFSRNKSFNQWQKDAGFKFDLNEAPQSIYFIFQFKVGLDYCVNGMLPNLQFGKPIELK